MPCGAGEVYPASVVWSRQRNCLRILYIRYRILTFLVASDRLSPDRRPSSTKRLVPDVFALSIAPQTVSDARYQLPDPSVQLVDELIMRHIDHGTRVIDLGCGDGRLMHRLQSEMGCHVVGIDVEMANIQAVIRRGLPVVAADLNQGLADIPSNSFDFAVLSQTLQQVQHPKLLLQEMLRVATRGLVVVPNFGHWRVRFEVLLRGRTPITETLPYEWHETPNVHFMSMRDFHELMRSIGLRIVKEQPIIRGRAVDSAWAANLRADSAFYLLERTSPERPKSA